MAEPRTPPATNAPSMIGGLVAALGAIEFRKLLDAAGGRPPEHALVGRELYLDARHHQQYLTTLRRNPACLFDHETWAIDSLPELPLGQLLGWRACGEPSGAEISLEGHVFVNQILCPDCGHSSLIAVLRARIEPSRLRCAGCDRDIAPTAVGLSTWIGVEWLSADMLREPLGKRGFRPGDVLTVRERDGLRHFEYAGERPPSRTDTGWHDAAIIGCGNIGSPLSAHVARLGRGAVLGRVILVDPDTYSEANIRTQEICCSDVGRAKVEVQAERMRAIHPELEVVTHACRIEDLPISVFRGAILLGAVDSRDARQQINQAAWRVGSPWIDMAVDGPSLLCRVTTYVPGDASVCLECSWEASDYALLQQRLPCDRIRDSQEIDAIRDRETGIREIEVEVEN